MAVSEANQAAFREWLTQQGGYINPKASLFHSLPSGDRGVYATADIAEGEQLLLVPLSCTLHLDVTDARGVQLPATCDKELAAFLTKAQQAAGQGKQQQQEQEQQAQQKKPFSSFLATTLMLMSELAKGAASPYSPYFSTLPAGTDCLIHWSKQEQQLLAGTSLCDVTRSIQDIFEADIAPVLNTRPDLFPQGCVCYSSFRRAADLVQTRAFHMSADNWITGTHQESTDELYLIPAIDMLNHSTQPGLRNTSLALCHGEVEVTLGDGDTRSFTNFFSMKAEKAIPSGTQILHTYGDLSDAQLLQTYGFIDVPPPQQQQQQEGQQQQEEGLLSSNPHNYVVLPLNDLCESVTAVAAAAKIWPAKKTKQVLSKRLSYLASVGLLQQQQPEVSQLMVTAAQPLPDELLTIVQVLMMTEPEFKQLQQAEQEEAQEAAAAAAAAAGSSGNGSAAAADQQQGVVRLNLGRDMLEDEFGELCGAVLLQAVDRWCGRYPSDLKASLTAVAASQPGSRPWLAAVVSAGEQLLLQQLKKGALMIMLGADQGDDDSEEFEGDGSSEGEGVDDSSSEEPAAGGSSSDSEEAKEQAAKAAAAAGGSKSKKRSRTQQQQEEEEEDEHKHSSKHKHKHSKKHHHHHKHNDPSSHDKQQHKKEHKKRGGAKKDDRPHYGDMTGPTEVDVWQSDDSDKVGYSSESGDEGERHPADASEHHTYEVGAAGAVREAHGHMLGPDEAALIESDDSDKVGYADNADSPDTAAAAAAAEQGDEGRGKGAAAGGKRGRRTAAAAAPAAGSKRPKRGLGFKD